MAKNSILNRCQKTTTNPSYVRVYGDTVRILAMKNQYKGTYSQDSNGESRNSDGRPLIGSQLIWYCWIGDTKKYLDHTRPILIIYPKAFF